MKEVIPRLSRVAVFGTSIQPGHTQSLGETELAAKELGIQLQYVDILDPKDIEAAFRTAGNGRTEAVLVLQTPIFNPRRAQLADLAIKSRLPGVYAQPEYAAGDALD